MTTTLVSDPNCGNPAAYPPPSAGAVLPALEQPPGCGNDGNYLKCGDQPCCNFAYADCVTCTRGPVCCVKNGNCCG